MSSQSANTALAVSACTLVGCLVAQASCEGRSGARAGEAANGYRGDALVESKPATWTCAGSPCPWGSTQTNHAVVWPASVQPVAARLGYKTSPPVYAPADRVNGMTLSIGFGKASVYAGTLSAPSHRLLATVSASQSFRVSGLADGEVLSVQSDAVFGYHLVLPRSKAPPAPPPDAGPPRPEAPRGPEVHARRALWRCTNTPGCFSEPWPGAVITWPAWAANQSNGRTGNVLRSVFAPDGTPLHPYMGAWADGCEVTAESGVVAVIEWQYGASEWRETKLSPRESHVIKLVPPENSALIESQDGSPAFSVSLRNCTPKSIRP